MPFKSLQQTRYMYKFHPKIAKKWHDETKKSGGKFPTKKKRYARGGKSTSPQLAKKRKPLKGDKRTKRRGKKKGR